MKRQEKETAIQMRKQGRSLADIAQTLGVSKASVSNWVRTIVLTQKQKTELTAHGFSKEAIEKRRIARILKTKLKHESLKLSASKEIRKISQRELLLLGAALYWGEGAKKSKNVASIANSDPNLVKIAMRFFREILLVPENKFKCHIHTFSHLNRRKAEKYWSHITNVPLSQFYKTYTKVSKTSKNKKDSLPFGTVQIHVCDTAIYLRIMGFIQGIKNSLLND